MSATRDLIAAALTAADELDQLHSPIRSLRADELREACARAMVQPDMAEVERLADEYATAVHDGRDNDCYKTRAALLDYVRGVLAERDHAVLCADAYKAEADQFRDAAKMVPDANDPDPLHLSRILHELAGAASMCWSPRPSTAVFDSQQAIAFVERAIAEIRQRMQMISAAPQPVSAAGVPMPEPDTHCYDDDVGRDVWSHSPEQMRTYGEQCRAAGYAAGVTSGAKQMFDYIQFAAANTSDTEWDTRLCELSQDALAAVSPAAHTEWKTIQRVASESRAAGEAAGYARGLAEGRERCAVEAWMYYMDTCKRNGIGPDVYPQWCCAAALRGEVK